MKEEGIEFEIVDDYNHTTIIGKFKVKPSAITAMAQRADEPLVTLTIQGLPNVIAVAGTWEEVHDKIFRKDQF
jgi:hypothetical protein